MSNLDTKDHKIDCSMCNHWTMFQCQINEPKYPYEGHLCAKFDIMPEHQLELQFELFE